jgi:hypothetical protein
MAGLDTHDKMTPEYSSYESDLVFIWRVCFISS